MVWFWCVSLFLCTSVCFTVYHSVLLGDICGEKESVCNLILWLVTFFNLIEWRFAFCVLKNSLWKICVCDVDSTFPLTVSWYLFRCSRISEIFFFCYGHSVLRMFIFWRYQCSLSLSLVYKFNDIYISNGSFKYLIKTSKQEKAAAAALSWLWHAAAGGNGFGGTVFVLKQLSKWNGLLNLHTFRWSTTYTVFKSDFYSSAAKIICRKIWHRIRNEEEFCVSRENSFSGIRMIIIILLSSFKVFNIHEIQYISHTYIHTLQMD